MKKNSNLDDVIAEVDEQESINTKNRAFSDSSMEGEQEDTNENLIEGTLIGVVEDFYSKISVVAIKLSGDLAAGDIIEISNGKKKLKLEVVSMQINRNNVDKAHDGDSVGVKVESEVERGSFVYKLQ